MDVPTSPLRCRPKEQTKTKKDKQKLDSKLHYKTDFHLRLKSHRNITQVLLCLFVCCFDFIDMSFFRVSCSLHWICLSEILQRLQDIQDNLMGSLKTEFTNRYGNILQWKTVRSNSKTLYTCPNQSKVHASAWCNEGFRLLLQNTGSLSLPLTGVPPVPACSDDNCSTSLIRSPLKIQLLPDKNSLAHKGFISNMVSANLTAPGYIWQFVWHIPCLLLCCKESMLFFVIRSISKQQL